MHNTLIVSLMGPDRPGLVAELASCVNDHGGNWIESRLVRLGGQFAGVLRIEVEPERRKALEAALHQLQSDALRFLLIGETVKLHSEVARNTVPIEVVGTDRPGILKAISAALTRHSANIEELATERRLAPMSGELLFHAKASLQLLSNSSQEELKLDLERIADDLMVDIHLDRQGPYG